MCVSGGRGSLSQSPLRVCHSSGLTAILRPRVTFWLCTFNVYCAFDFLHIYLHVFSFYLFLLCGLSLSPSLSYWKQPPFSFSFFHSLAYNEQVLPGCCVSIWINLFTKLIIIRKHICWAQALSRRRWCIRFVCLGVVAAVVWVDVSYEQTSSSRGHRKHSWIIHNTELFTQPWSHARLPMLKLLTVPLLSWKFQWPWWRLAFRCLHLLFYNPPKSLCAFSTVLPNLSVHSRNSIPPSLHFLSPQHLIWIIWEITSQFCLHSHRGKQSSQVNFLIISANLRLDYWTQTRGQGAIIPIWKQRNKCTSFFCLFVYLFVCLFYFVWFGFVLWWSFLSKVKKSSSLLTGKLSLECFFWAVCFFND